MRSITDHYEDRSTAAEYRDRFKKSLTRRLSNALEVRMLGKALARAGVPERMLDVPCGAGRLVAALLRSTRSLTCVDGARAMLDEARARPVFVSKPKGARASKAWFAQASAFDLPFPDKAFDVTVCWRLLHHLVDPADRRRLLLELGRVTERSIILSFSDAGTARAQRIRRRARGLSGRVAIHRDALASEIEACGFTPERFYRLFGPFSVLGAVVIRVSSI